MNKYRLSICTAVALLTLTGEAAWSATPPPAESEAPVTKVQRAPVHGLKLGAFQVKFEQTTLDDVQRALGGQQGHHGDAGNSESWLCYTLVSRKGAKPGSLRLWLMSSELNGNNRIDHVVAMNVADNGPVDGCTPLAPRYAQAKFDNSIWLGAKSGAVASRLAGPAPETNGQRTYEFSGTKPIKLNGKTTAFDVNSRFEVTDTDGRISAISAGQSTTN